ncbi:MAG: hypothetical protein KC457_28280, partial [Myxococcales bacterium]|nr:hypothetical protein [Myxococcales bacterium]
MTAAAQQRPFSAGERLAALDAEQQDVLVVLALHNESLAISQWFKRYQRTIPAARQVSRADFDKAVEALLDAKMIRMHGPTRYVALEFFVLPLLSLLADAGRLPNAKPSPHWYYEPSVIQTKVRLALVRGHSQELQQTLARVDSIIHKRELGLWLVETLGLAPDVAVLSRLSAAHQRAYLSVLLHNCLYGLLPVPEALRHHIETLGDKHLLLELGRLSTLRDESFEWSAKALPRQGPESLALIQALFAGELQHAAELGDRAVTTKTGKLAVIPSFEGSCHLLARLACDGKDPAALVRLAPVLEASDAKHAGMFDVIGRIHRALQGERHELSGLLAIVMPHQHPSWFDLWQMALHDIWLGLETGADEPAAKTGKKRPAKTPAAKRQGKGMGLDHGRWLLQHHEAVARINGYSAVARELAAALAALGVEGYANAPAGMAQALCAASPWESALTGLDAIVAGEAVTAQTPSERCLVWELTVDGRKLGLAPRLRESSRARKGRLIPVESLAEGEHDDLLGEDDRRVLSAMELDDYSWRPRMVLGKR